MATWWAYPTNYSNGTIVDGVSKMFFEYPSAITGGFFGTGLLILIWVVTFALSSGSGSVKGLMTASFITFIFSVLFFRVGMVSLYIVMIFVLLLAIGVIGSKQENNY
jgi:hypothetical protein